MERPEFTMEDIVTLVSTFEGEFIIDVESMEDDEEDV